MSTTCSALLPNAYAELRLAAAELLAALASAYAPKGAGSTTGSPTPVTAVTPAMLEELHGLLGGYAGHSEHRVRLAVLDWAVRIFPFSNVRARYICMRLVGMYGLTVWKP